MSTSESDMNAGAGEKVRVIMVVLLCKVEPIAGLAGISLKRGTACATTNIQFISNRKPGPGIN